MPCPSLCPSSNEEITSSDDAEPSPSSCPRNEPGFRSENGTRTWFRRLGAETDKEAILDEILDYVKFLRLQVKLLGKFLNVFPVGHEHANMLYGLLIKHGSKFVDDLFVVSSAISMYSGLSDVPFVRWVFDRAAEKNIQVWNTMIGRYVQNDLFKKGLAFFSRVLESQSVVADTVTFLESLVAASQEHDVELGRQIHALLAKGEAQPRLIHNQTGS